MFTHAKQAQAQIFVDECMEIADDSSRDVMKNAKGEEVCDNEFVQRSRLRIDTRKWVTSANLSQEYTGIKSRSKKHPRRKKPQPKFKKNEKAERE